MALTKRAPAAKPTTTRRRRPAAAKTEAQTPVLAAAPAADAAEAVVVHTPEGDVKVPQTTPGHDANPAAAAEIESVSHEPVAMAVAHAPTVLPRRATTPACPPAIPTAPGSAATTTRPRRKSSRSSCSRCKAG